MVERFSFDPFGIAQVRDSSWSIKGSGSEYAWYYMHQSGRYDSVSGQLTFRKRDYGPSLGRWTSPDPIRYEARSANLYLYLFNRPLVMLDPQGTDPIVTWGAMVAPIITCIAPVFIDLKRNHGTEWTHDKWAHCVASCQILKRCGNVLSILVGVGKEALDELLRKINLGGTGWDPEDLAADAQGLACADVSTFNPVIGWIKSCFQPTCRECCDKYITRF
jgi:RHS repeat-associated protein